jgi:hypothetical protein
MRSRVRVDAARSRAKAGLVSGIAQAAALGRPRLGHLHGAVIRRAAICSRRSAAEVGPARHGAASIEATVVASTMQRRNCQRSNGV